MFKRPGEYQNSIVQMILIGKNVLIQFPNILKIPVVINMVIIKILYVQMGQIGKKLLKQ